MLISLLRAAIILATAKRTTETKRASLRPQISLLLAQMGPAAALESKYTAPIQVYPEAEPREVQIVGIDVATMVWSRAVMKQTS
jgi:hypothetical protein